MQAQDFRLISREFCYIKIKKLEKYCFLHFFLYICKKSNMVYLYKIMVFILVFCVLNVIKDLSRFVFSFLNNKNANFSNFRLLGFGLSISYIITIIFTGFF